VVRGLRESSFYFWRRELQRRRQEGRGRRVAGQAASANGVFLPVVVSPTPAASAAPSSIEVLLGDAIVRVPAEFRVESLARVVTALRASQVGEGSSC
jgi:hypothetical protein